MSFTKAAIIDTYSTNQGSLAPQRFSLVLSTTTGEVIQIKPRSLDGGAISTSPARVMLPVASIPVQSDKIDDSSIDIEFTISETMNEYAQLYNLIWTSVTSEQKIEFTAVLNIYTSHGNIIRVMTFHNAVIATLSSPNFDSTSTVADPVTASVTFDYSHMTMT